MSQSKRKVKASRFVEVAVAMVLLLNMLYALPVSAAQPRSIMTSYPVLTTSDGVVSVKLCLTYQESTNIYTGASVQELSFLDGTRNVEAGTPYLSSDRKTIYVRVVYEVKQNGSYVVKEQTLSKSCK